MAGSRLQNLKGIPIGKRGRVRGKSGAKEKELLLCISIGTLLKIRILRFGFPIEEKGDTYETSAHSITRSYDTDGSYSNEWITGFSAAGEIGFQG